MGGEIEQNENEEENGQKEHRNLIQEDNNNYIKEENENNETINQMLYFSLPLSHQIFLFATMTKRNYYNDKEIR